MAFIRTSPFRKDPQYSRSIVVPLHRPTADTSATGGVYGPCGKREEHPPTPRTGQTFRLSELD